MSSVSTKFAQNESRKFISLLASAGGPPLTSGTKIYTLAGIVSAFPANSVSNVGSLYVVDTMGHYASFVTALDTGSGLTPAALFLTRYDTLTDMGHELWVGVLGKESTLLKLRSVKNSATAASGVAGDGGLVGYVVVENNAFEAGMNTLADLAPVTVARV